MKKILILLIALSITSCTFPRVDSMVRLNHETQYKRLIGTDINQDELTNTFKIFVKSRLHNPRSFEHIDSSYFSIKDNLNNQYIYGVMDYRAENGFGALRIGISSLLFDLNGNIIGIGSIPEHRDMDLNILINVASQPR